MLPKFTQYLDVNYSLGVIEKLNSYESNPDLGYRTSGSAAEFAAAEYLYNEMRAIGMKNVRKDAVTVDNFEFKRADLIYQMPNGNPKKIILSAFQARCFAEDEKIKVVYVGKGTQADYEGRDVAGKYVLVDINMVDDWFIYWAVGQAASKKAAGIIVVQVDGYCSWSADTLGVQDISTNANLPTLSMTVRDADVFKEHLKANGGELECVLNADVRITNNGITHNVIGEIPGEIDEVVYLIGHYDGYFRAFSDNASGIAAILGICRAFVASGWKPKRTLRVCLHGAEEWGLENSRYDWARGATMEVRKHPEWAENGFMLVNLDGNLIQSDATSSAVRTAWELEEGIREMGQSVEGNIYPFTTLAPLWTWTESYMYAMLGIPTIESWYEGVNFWPSYHSTSDTREVNYYSDEAYLSSHILYGTLLQKIDALEVRPLKFTALFDQLRANLDRDTTGGCPALEAAIDQVYAQSKALKEKEAKLAGQSEALRVYNAKIAKVFAKIINELFGLDWYENYHFIHMRNQNNIQLLNKVLSDAAAKDYDAAYENLRGVDLCWYAYHFDRETYDYFVNQVIGDDVPDTWAIDKVGSIADLYDVAKEIAAAKAGKGSISDAALEKIKAEIQVQKAELARKLEKEADIVNALAEMMEEA